MVGAGAVGDLFGHIRHGVFGVHCHDGKGHCTIKLRALLRATNVNQSKSTLLRATCVPIATLVPDFKNEGLLVQQVMVGG
jgi:hypothetical protein